MPFGLRFETLADLSPVHPNHDDAERAGAQRRRDAGPASWRGGDPRLRGGRHLEPRGGPPCWPSWQPWQLRRPRRRRRRRRDCARQPHARLIELRLVSGACRRHGALPMPPPPYATPPTTPTHAPVRTRRTPLLASVFPFVRAHHSAAPTRSQQPPAHHRRPTAAARPPASPAPPLSPPYLARRRTLSLSPAGARRTVRQISREKEWGFDTSPVAFAAPMPSGPPATPMGGMLHRMSSTHNSE